MFSAVLKATIKDKKTGALIGEFEVMEMKYCVKDNVLWITDHRSRILDFDLNECDADIRMAK